jgi:peptidoglycan/LPS O-acetylase OafA/YrhL
MQNVQENYSWEINKQEINLFDCCPNIDVLRGLAVIAVVIYHLNKNRIPHILHRLNLCCQVSKQDFGMVYFST